METSETQIIRVTINLNYELCGPPPGDDARGELGAALGTGLTELPGPDACGIQPGVWSLAGTSGTGLVRCFEADSCLAVLGLTIAVFSS